MKRYVAATHPDAGFDLYMPANVSVPSGAISFKLPLGVKCSAYIREIPSSFTTVPRSSMGSKTSLRLSNSIGIIDSGYRGELMAFVDNIGPEVQNLTTETRLFQIVAPTLMPIFVEIARESGRLRHDTSRRRWVWFNWRNCSRNNQKLPGGTYEVILIINI